VPRTTARASPLDYVREGDTVVVWKLDRLGRNTLHILETVKAFTDRGVTLVSTNDGIDRFLKLRLVA
jgi:DNA invertase Pin-like site-specific DNA recombinase